MNIAIGIPILLARASCRFDRFRGLGFAALAILLLVGGASAQLVCAIQGDAKAADGSAIKGAQILINRIDLAGNYSVKTDNKGHYAHKGLPIGRYKISLLLNGEVADSVDNIRTRLGDPVIINFDLGKTASKAPTSPLDAQQGESVAGLYVAMQDSANQLQLNADGSFWLIEKGKKLDGSFTVAGNQLTLKVGQRVSTNTIQGDRILHKDGQTWVRQAAMAEPPPPPPPPSDAPVTKTIEQGQTMEQVIAALGQPVKIVKLGSKQIYFYKDLKVTFTDSKVSDVE